MHIVTDLVADWLADELYRYFTDPYGSFAGALSALQIGISPARDP